MSMLNAELVQNLFALIGPSNQWLGENGRTAILSAV
jgi:hypothetical protein